MVRVIRGFIVMTFLIAGNECFSQEDSPAVERRKEQLEEQEAKKKEMAEEAHREGIEQHMQIQTKEVRKRMKKNKRKSKRINHNKREFFLVRWFS